MDFRGVDHNESLLENGKKKKKNYWSNQQLAAYCARGGRIIHRPERNTFVPNKSNEEGDNVPLTTWCSVAAFELVLWRGIERQLKQAPKATRNQKLRLQSAV